MAAYRNLDHAAGTPWRTRRNDRRALSRHGGKDGNGAKEDARRTRKRNRRMARGVVKQYPNPV